MDLISSLPLKNSADIASALIIGFFAALTVATFRLLSWAFPKTFKLYVKAISEYLNKDTNSKLEEIRKELSSYKGEKHAVESENLTLREILKIEDPEIRKHVLEIFEKQQAEKLPNENN